MIRVNRLKVEDFKNIKKQTFDFSQHDGLTLFIGNNGSGKSNVLEFISGVFSNLLSGSVLFDKNFEIEWEVDGHRNEVWFNNGHLTEKHDGQLKSVTNTMDYPKRVIAIYSGESNRLWQNFYMPFYFNFINTINQNQTGAVNVNGVFPRLLYLNKYYWDLALLSLLCSDSADVIDFLRSDLKVAQVDNIRFTFKDPQQYSSFAVSPVLQFVKNIDGRQDYSLQDFKQILASLNIDAQQLFEYLYIAYLPKNSKIIEHIEVTFNGGLNIEMMSEGLKKRLLIRAALELAGNENTLFLLDEPDAHVHVDNKKVIIDSIKQFRQNRHIFITSHSPSVCGDVEAQSIVLMNNGKPESVGDQIEAGKKLASDVTLINMLFTNKHLILTEGKTDIAYIQKAISFFSTNYPTLAGQTEFIELSGTDGNADLAFMSKITTLQGRKIIRLVDRDGSGLTCANILLGNHSLKTTDYSSARTIPTIQNGLVVMLPIKPGANGNTPFIIEDYFKADKIRDLTKNYIDSEYQGKNYKGFPAVRDDLKKILLPNFSQVAQAADMEDFKVLLDLLEQTLTMP